MLLSPYVLLFSEVRVEGLETLDYLDNLHNKERFTEQGDAITFESEVSWEGHLVISFYLVTVGSADSF